MRCPKCNDETLIEYDYGSGVFRCGACSGHWLKYQSLESYLVERDEMTAKAFRAIWDLQSETSETLKCPHDQSGLRVFTYKATELDFCMECKGLWFDALEMEGFASRDDLNLPKTTGSEGTTNHGSSYLVFEAATAVIGCVLGNIDL